jgi:hypothetical protein
MKQHELSATVGSPCLMGWCRQNLLEEGLLLPPCHNQMARKDKKEVGKTVDIATDLLGHWLLLCKSHNTPLGPTADGTAHMALGGGHVAPRNDEMAELGQRLLQTVDGML